MARKYGKCVECGYIDTVPEGRLKKCQIWGQEGQVWLCVECRHTMFAEGIAFDEVA